MLFSVVIMLSCYDVLPQKYWYYVYLCCDRNKGLMGVRVSFACVYLVIVLLFEAENCDAGLLCLE